MAVITDGLIEKLEVEAMIIRKGLVRMITEAGTGHVAPALSCVDVITALYFYILNVDPQNSAWPERDRFVLSKGHGCAALYWALARKGFFPQEMLDTFCRLDSRLAGHPDMRKIPGVEMSTGSLGHGLSISVGMALAAKLDKKSYRIFTLLGDGENQEGSVWEAAMAAANYRLDNLTAIVDRNSLQAAGFTERIMNLEPLADKWRSFGWSVREIDGHKMREILEVLSSVPLEREKPSLIIAHTIKGKGISFMENRPEWHYRAPTPEQGDQALKELQSSEGRVEE